MSSAIPGLGGPDSAADHELENDKKLALQADVAEDEELAAVAGKRTAQEAGLEPEGHIASKQSRKGEDVDLDPIVQARLEELFAKGVARPDELDAMSLRELAGFPPSMAIQVLDQFEQSDLSTVRNKSGYLGGVMTRLRRQPGVKLPTDVQQRLDNMFRSGKIKASDLDSKCYEMLASMPVAAVVTALDKFAQRDLRDVRNYSAFLSSQLRSAEKQVYGDQGSHQHHGSHQHQYGLMPHPLDDRDRRSSRAPSYSNEPSSTRYPSPGYASSRPGSYAPTPMTNSQGRGAPARTHQGHEQKLAGVRVDEFHGLADVACYVPAPVALKLQNLWDTGVKLVAMLDDRSWDVLAELGAPEGLAAVNEVAVAMERPGGLRNVNAYFMSIAGKLMTGGRAGGGGGGGGMGGGGGGGGGSSLQRHPAPSYTPDAPASYGGGYSGSAIGGYSGSAVGSGPSTYGGSRGGGGSGSGRDDSYRSRDAPRGGRDDFRPPPAGAARGVSALNQLSDTLRDKAERVIAAASSHLNTSHFDEGVVSALDRLGERSAMQVLDEVLVNDLGAVRNIPAYIMGICKRHRDRRE